MKPIVTQISENGVVHMRLSGTLTVRFHAELHSAFSSIKDDHAVHLELAEPSAIDLDFLQLFYAFTRFVRSTGRKVTVTAGLSETDVQILRNTGFLALLTNNPR